MGFSALTFQDEARNRALKTVVWCPAPQGTSMEANTTAPFVAAKDAPVSDAQPRWPLVVLSHVVRRRHVGIPGAMRFARWITAAST
ncbi:hypothetical protein HV824_07410 [Myxococcus sp. AM009]|nr:hypothetical protein [Myxococcus sp. AM009]NVI97947.1 hypothetical protein [Myxococcus sp. AM009]